MWPSCLRAGVSTVDTLTCVSRSPEAPVVPCAYWQQSPDESSGLGRVRDGLQRGPSPCGDIKGYGCLTLPISALFVAGQGWGSIWEGPGQ